MYKYYKLLTNLLQNRNEAKKFFLPFKSEKYHRQFVTKTTKFDICIN